MSYKVGDTLGSYLLLAECGTGAYGSVFLAKNTITERQVALKIVYRQGRNCERELKGLAQYQTVCPHTNLLQIYHVDQNDECFWYTMDAADNRSKESNCYVPDTLANRLRECGRLPVEEIRKMALELVSALETIHKLGLLYRDVKPDNILWVNGQAKLGDIGLVTEKAHGSMAGTPVFLPREVLAGLRKHSERDDFYSLGKVIYCALTGMPVEKYPAWPDSLTLSGGEKLIEWYNRLCDGGIEVSAEECRKALSSGVRSRWRFLYWFGVPVIGLLLLTALFFLPKSPESSPQEKPIVSPVATSTAPVIEKPTEQLPQKKAEELGLENHSILSPLSPVEYKRELAKLAARYVPSGRFLELLPVLEAEYSKLNRLKFERSVKAASTDFSETDLAEARQYLAVHPEEFISDPEAYLHTKRFKDAQKKFEEEHLANPLWEYFSNREAISLEAGDIVHVADNFPDSKYDLESRYKAIQTLYPRQAELEKILLAKYSPFVKSEK